METVWFIGRIIWAVFLIAMWLISLIGAIGSSKEESIGPAGVFIGSSVLLAVMQLEGF